MLARITGLVNGVIAEAGGSPLTGEDVLGLIGGRARAAGRVHGADVCVCVFSALLCALQPFVARV
jgi:hypothetical protein